MLSFSKFVSVGLLATATQYLILTYLVEMYGFRAALASTVGFVIAAVVNYLLNRRFTFRSNVRHAVAAPRFFAVALAGAALNAGIIGFLDSHTSLRYLISQTFATSVVLVWNFTANAIWTFRKPDQVYCLQPAEEDRGGRLSKQADEQ